jgi:hypothetical protein
MGRHRSVPAGKQHPALRDDPAPGAQDLTSRSSNRLVRDATLNGSEHFWLWAAAGESVRKPRKSFTVNASIDQAAIGLAAATLLGASIGFERQWRQRMAG